MRKAKPKLLIVSGTRPDTIKVAPLVLKLKKNKKFDTKFLVTGQHKELLQQALEAFKLKPDYNLKLMSKNQSTTDVLIKILTKGQKFLDKNQFDLVLVHGDTMTAQAFSYLAFLHKIKVAHIEAGLRTFDLQNPFPEEASRQIIDIYATILFPPTKHAFSNLSKRDLKGKSVIVTGNTIVDAINLLNKASKLTNNSDYLAPNKKNVLVTLHRRESFGKELQNVFEAIKKSALQNIEANFIIPVHPNPNVKKPIYELLGGVSNIRLIKPISYIEMLGILKQVRFIVTDSGGIQEEAPSFNKPVLVARKVTERPEGIKAGILRLVGTDTKYILKYLNKYLNDESFYKKLSKIKNPFGDGKACDRIINFLEKYFEIN